MRAPTGIEASFAFLLALAACGDDPAGPLPLVALTRVSGDGQTGRPGQVLPGSLVVRATDGRGRPISSLEVTWTVVQGEGALNGLWGGCPVESGPLTPMTELQTRTDQDGFTQMRLMPAWFGPVRVIATAAAGVAALFTADATDPDATIELTTTADHEGEVGPLGLPTVLSVRVRDGQGNAVTGVRVDWRLVAGNGEFWDLDCPRGVVSETRTGAGGEATVRFVPGVEGTNEITASVLGIPASAAFTAYGYTTVIGLKDEPWLRGVGFYGPRWSNVVTAPLGSPVDFLNYTQSARIVSTEVPPGGSPFDSGPLVANQRFRFVAPVPGTWKFADQVSGAIGVLVVQ